MTAVYDAPQAWLARGRHVDGNYDLYSKRRFELHRAGFGVRFGPAGAAVDSTRGPAGLETVLYRILALLALGALLAATIAMVRSMRYFTRHDPAHRDPEIIKDLETQKTWEDVFGKHLDVPVSGTPAAWYTGELFDDFILRANFEIIGPGHVCFYVWSTKGTGATWSKQNAIHIKCSGRDCDATGSINAQAPVRSAVINPRQNTLEITCASDHCTVRVNGETINRVRVKRMRDKRRWRLGTPRPLPGAVGIEKVESPRQNEREIVTASSAAAPDACAGITVNQIEVEKIETAWSTGATQGQVQRRIIAPLFFAAFLATFLFGFGDYTPGAHITDVISGQSSMRHWIGVPPVVKPWTWWWSALAAGGISATILLAAQFLIALWRERNLVTKIKRILPSAISIFVAAAVGGLIAWALYYVFRGKTVWEVMVWGTPALLAAFFVTIIVHIGLLGRGLGDERREWWSRLCAWLLIYALAWIGIFGLAFYGPVLPGSPLLVPNLGERGRRGLDPFDDCRSHSRAECGDREGEVEQIGRARRESGSLHLRSRILYSAFLCRRRFDQLAVSQGASARHGISSDSGRSLGHIIRNRALPAGLDHPWSDVDRRGFVGALGHQSIFHALALSESPGAMLLGGVERGAAGSAFYRIFVG